MPSRLPWRRCPSPPVRFGPKSVFAKPETGVRHRAEIAVRFRPFWLYDFLRNTRTFSPVANSGSPKAVGPPIRSTTHQKRTAYALRSPQRIIQQARFVGASVGAFAEQLLAEPHPWARLRQAQKLLRLAERYGPNRLDQACAYALSFELLNVRRLEHILELALDQPSPAALAPSDEPLAVLNQAPASSRFARPGTAFDHRFRTPVGIGS